ncbi:MAG TPA: hypothetical protein GX000_00770 [Actinomyces sp.]|nr:hypothetical protein [Actinomyces sp.]
MNDKSIDDEFERIISGLENESDPEMGTDSSQPSRESSDPSEDEPELDESTDSHDSTQPEDASEDSAEAAEEPQNLDEPEDEHLHLEGGRRSVGLVLAPLRPASGVARMLGMYGLARWIVPIANQIVLYLELDEDADEEEAEFESLLGEDRPMPEEVDRFARVISKLSKYGAIAVVSNLSEEDSLISGSIAARRYVNGAPEDAIPGGLLINSIDSRAEDLLLGRTHPSDYPDAIHAKDRPKPHKRGFGPPFLK